MRKAYIYYTYAIKRLDSRDSDCFKLIKIIQIILSKQRHLDSKRSGLGML